MNSSIIKGETSLVTGFGLAKFDNEFTNEVDMGGIFRFFMGNNLSLKIDCRYHFYFAADAENNMSITAGLSYAFGNDSAAPVEKKEKDEDTD